MSTISGLAVVIALAAALGVAAKFLKQPLVLAYLITGIAIGYFGFFDFDHHEVFQTFSDLGIMFLLFLVGLEINYSSLRLVGRASLIIGLLQIAVTTLLGFIMAQLFHFSALHSAYIAIALTLSSTVIVVKLLSDKKDLHSLYGKIVVGFLLVQDFVAILILAALSGLDSGNGPLIGKILLTVVEGVALFGAMLWLGRTILPRIFDAAARSDELLFLISLAWVFILAAGVKAVGFPIEIAGFLAGVALANSSEHYEIAGRVKPLRDFFILLFFAILGSSMILTDFKGLGAPILIFSLFVLVIDPLIVLAIMGIMGYRRRTSFFAGATVGQISEFSFVLAAVGLKVGHLTSDVVALITAVGIITITLSTYLITYSDAIFRRFSPYLAFFERKKMRESSMPATEIRKPIVLIGAHRTGQTIAFALPKKDLLIIDFDPEVANHLRKHGFDYLFGDISDPFIFERANIGKARLVISTSPDFDDNMTLIAELAKLPQRPKVVVRAETEQDAELLYGRGADYVLLPNFTAGQYLAKTIAVDPDMKILERLKQNDLEMLKRQHI